MSERSYTPLCLNGLLSAKEKEPSSGVIGAEDLLGTLGRLGVDYAFLTMGVDLVAVPEAFARLQAKGVKLGKGATHPAGVTQ